MNTGLKKACAINFSFILRSNSVKGLFVAVATEVSSTIFLISKPIIFSADIIFKSQDCFIFEDFFWHGGYLGIFSNNLRRIFNFR